MTHHDDTTTPDWTDKAAIVAGGFTHWLVGSIKIAIVLMAYLYVLVTVGDPVPELFPRSWESVALAAALGGIGYAVVKVVYGLEDLATDQEKGSDSASNS